ncbi:MAG: type II secretion system protein [Planctomycetota bacterium]
MASSSPKFRRAGVTLLECVVAIAVLGTAVVAGLEMLGSHQAAAAREESIWKALLVLDNETEKIKVSHYDQLATTAFTVSADDPAYDVRWIVNQETVSCRRVTIEVRWASPSGRYDRRSLEVVRCEGVE